MSKFGNFWLMSDERCLICGHNPVETCRVGRATMHRCPQCSAVMTPPAQRATANPDYYETQYTLTDSVRTDTEMHRYFRYPEYAALIGRVLRLYEHETITERSWLDIGCDHGFFLDDVRRYGFRVAGVEPSERARTYAQSIGLNVVPDVRQISDTFSVISLWHVLEHLDSPVEVLRDVYERCAPGGVLCIRVPDATSFWARLLRDRWIWFQPHHHLVHYSPSVLRDVVERAGFTVTEVRRQKPNTRFTKRAYRLSTHVFAHTLQRPFPSLRKRAARWYQDVTGCELFLLARKP